MAHDYTVAGSWVDAPEHGRPRLQPGQAAAVLRLLATQPDGLLLACMLGLEDQP